MKQLALAAVLATIPCFALAQACGSPDENGCPHGTIWSPLTKTCETLTMA